MHLISVLLLCTIAAYGSATKYTDCGSQTGKVTAVEVSNCPDGQDVCTLTKGSQPQITIKFTSQAESQNMKAVVHGVIAGVPIPFPIPQPDACKSGVSCPVKNGESYTYSNAFNVRKSYPSVGVTVRYELKDENDKDMACVDIPCKLE